MLMVGFDTVPLKVTGAPELQVITCVSGITVLVGATVFTPMVMTCVLVQFPTGFVPVTVYVPCCPILNEAVLPVAE